MRIMPELPEVQVIADQLDDVLKNAHFLDIDILRAKNVESSGERFREDLPKAKVQRVFRRAKYIIIEFSEKRFITIHLRMTGQVLVKDSFVKPDSYVRAVLYFSSITLWFRNIRAFGRIQLLDESQYEALDNKYGPEPLEKHFLYEIFNDILEKYPKKIIKTLLLDQKIIAGIGNIYANEVLYTVKISPQRKVQDITPTERKQLYIELRAILKKALEVGGCSDNTYRDIYNKKGGFNTHLRVYRKQGDTCTVCGIGAIERILVAQRGTYMCSMCQK